MGPNRRAQERERAAAGTKRTEADRKAIVDGQKIVGTVPDRQSGRGFH
jgi:hypothetical protein